MTLNGVMAVTLRYFTEFGKHTFQHNCRVDLWRNLCMSLLYFVVRVRCRRKESSRSLSHLLMSFLFRPMYSALIYKIISTNGYSYPTFRGLECGSSSYKAIKGRATRPDIVG